MRPLSLFFLLFIANISAAQSFEGWWHGKVTLMGTDLRLSMELKPEEDQWKITFLSPDQGNMPIPGGTVEIKGDSLYAEHEAMKVYMEAELKHEEEKIKGEFHQMGMSSEIVLGRDTVAPTIRNRPQTPKDFSAFYTEDVFIPNPESGHKLAATISLPTKKGGCPVVILASGSGPTDRNATMMDHELFKVIAYHLAEQGIGCIRFDDRGVGESEGNHREATVEDFGSDVKAIYNYAKTRDEFSAVGLAGHSEGGMHIMIANKALKGKVDFLIFLACAGVKGEDLYLKQHELVGEKAGLSKEETNENVELFRTIIAIGRKEKYPGKAIEKHLDGVYDRFPEKTKKPVGSKFQYIATIMSFCNNDWFRQFMDFEPKKYYKSMKKVPVLVLNGSRDIQVDCTQNLGGFETGLKKVKSTDFAIHKMEGMNHLFQKCEACSINEYGVIETTIEPVVLNTVSNWINNLK